MQFPRASVALVIAVSFIVNACGDDLSQSTAPVSVASTNAPRYLVRAIPATTVDGSSATPSSDAVVNVWMGVRAAALMQVRVVDQFSAPVAGVHVQFVTHHATRNRVLESALTASSATSIAVSDVNGLATLPDVTFPSRDTVADAYTVTATFLAHDAGRVDSAGASVRVSVQAWRDVSRFGGDAPLVFTTMPIAQNELQAILPLGTFNRDDALPAADAMLIPRDALQPSVRAMATGIVTEVDRAHGAVTMRVRDSIRIRVSGMSLRAALWVGAVVREGEVLGAVDASLTGARSVAVRVFDTAIQRDHWVRPERYGARRSASFFIPYLADALRSDAFALVRRAAPDLAGTIDYDRAGRLVGSWFDPTAPTILSVSASAVSSAAAAAAANATSLAFLTTAQRMAEFDPSQSLGAVALTFAYDAQQPGEIRIAAGRALEATIGMSGVRAVAWEDQDPARVSIASGVVRYRLFESENTSRVGRSTQILMTQLIDDTHLRVELVSGDEGARAFSERAVILVR